MSEPGRDPSVPGGAGELGGIRERIDELDRRLVGMLNERARLVVEVGRVKRQSGVPIYAPHREAEVLARVLAMNQGPLDPRTIESIYREIMSGSFSLERGISIGYLGPAGSFSHAAAARHFGSSVEFHDLHAIEGVFEEVARGHVDYGLVPIENSIMGGIVETLDAFAGYAGRVRIYAEAQVEIHHALLANCGPERVRRIYSKPEVFAQCRGWLATQYPGVPLVPVASSSRAAQMVAEESERAERDGVSGESDGCSAAVAGQLAGEIYDVSVLFENIEDRSNNITRFFVLAREEAKRTGDDKTSMVFETLDKPGALVAVLAEFDRAGVNLTHIDKRPAGRQNWTYSFFVDAQGHEHDDAMGLAIDGARAHCQHLTVLGSYPRSRRIL